ncbi:hypothetical protein PL321_15970 [Caloramator sp. mosi_1]|uniref:hypothetical protein n=1 Tax=Caloramator sp. mosi_1 TaxID=3023090 RepID=UPI002360E90F|nr:hypothetical protein [Caloramator sp. mosi_1]WDC83909.1 hypothetical protein PL321_15970 [Caloramator sp. mosi_1]
MELLIQIRNIKLEDLGKINYDKASLNKIDNLLEQYIKYQLSITLNTVSFIKNIF